MKKTYKIILIILIIINAYSILYASYAAQIWDTGNAFLSMGANTKSTYLSSLWKNWSQNNAKAGYEAVIGFLWGLGLLVIFISTVVIGIKYMLVLPNEKSRIKQATTPYIIGVVIIFGALTIWRLLIQILDPMQ